MYSTMLSGGKTGRISYSWSISDSNCFQKVRLRSSSKAALINGRAISKGMGLDALRTE